MSAGPKQTFQKHQSPFSLLDPTCTAVTQTVRSNLLPVKDPSISWWGPHQLSAGPKQTFRKQQSLLSILDLTYTATHRCHTDCLIQLVPSERPFNLVVQAESKLFGTSNPRFEFEIHVAGARVCKLKANFSETTIPVFNSDPSCWLQAESKLIRNSNPRFQF